MKYFITGATGFIGGRVARQLVEAGHQVVALARTPSKAADLLKLGVAVHAGDIVDKESMRRPMAGVDGVFHLAAWYKIGARDKTLKNCLHFRTELVIFIAFLTIRRARITGVDGHEHGLYHH